MEDDCNLQFLFFMCVAVAYRWFVEIGTIYLYSLCHCEAGELCSFGFTLVLVLHVSLNEVSLCHLEIRYFGLSVSKVCLFSKI